MTTRAIERVDEWDTRPFGGGYRGLHDLADRDFSGVVRSPAGTLCMLNGAVVGIVDGRIENFEGADGTAYEAPCQALPLLIVMQKEAEDVRAKYYTEDTPLSKVDSTLSDGGFTGFVELSENVLSGDYYVVYQGGRSMSVAFVGNSGKLLSGEEAFERADDEVGIYKVRDVDIDPIEIPDAPERDTEAATGGAADAGSGADAASEQPDEAEADDIAAETSPTSEDEDHSTGSTAATDDTIESEATGAGGTTRSGSPEQGTVARDPAERSAAEEVTEQSGTEGGHTQTENSDADAGHVAQETGDAESSARTAQSTTEMAEQSAEEPGAGTTEKRRESETEATTESRSSTHQSGGKQSAPREATERAGETQSSGSPTGESRSSGGNTESARSRNGRAETGQSTASRGGSEATQSGAGSGGARQSGERASGGPSEGARSGSGSAADLETRTIPSLDPDRSRSGTQGGSRSGSATTTTGANAAGERSSARSPTAPSTQPEGSTTTDQRAGQSTGESESRGVSADRVEELESTISEREQRIEELEGKLRSVREERDEVASERDEAAAERDELEETLERVRGELKRIREERDALEAQLESAEGVDPDAGERRLSPSDAMDGTDLFVRYDSKGEPTLKTAHESGASRSDVNANLNVEWHTQFETEGAVVAGQPYETYLQNTIEYRFVSWVVRELLFEIRETGHHNALSDLFDALPRIDRAELNGEASVEYTEDGQTKRTRESFDVVLRDRMGNPLVVANFNDSRQAATEDDMRSLVTSATRVGETAASLAGAMYVTASFFEPEALEMASDATGGGLLSRDKRESFVKVSRKQGYHLCLVEARDQQFHMAVPEL